MEDFILDRSHFRIKNIHQQAGRKPYPFQQEAFGALDRLKEKYPDGFATMLVLPTGGGKTYTAVHWILKNYVDRGIKVLWIAHRSELLRQAAESFYRETSQETLPNRESFESYIVSSEFGRSCNLVRPGADTDVVIAGRQSICSGQNMQYYKNWVRGKGLKAERKLLLVFDEAHHAAAKSYRKIIADMKRMVPHVDILGLTATPYRTGKEEQGSLKHIFHTDSGIVYRIDTADLISSGILAVPIHIDVHTGLDMTELFDAVQMKRIARLDVTSLEESDLRKLSENAARNRIITDTYLNNRKKFGKTIVFALDVLNAIALNALFQAAGVRSDYVVSSLSAGLNRSFSAERNPQVIRNFKNGKIDVLINVNILTEGTDIPNIQTVFLARPTTSGILMNQMIGRGLRGVGSGGTEKVNLVYFVDDWKNMVSFVSPRELLDGEDRTQNSAAGRREKLKRYIQIAELEKCAVEINNQLPPVSVIFRNMIPYGVIHCSYLQENGAQEEEYHRDILVYDEGKEILERILRDLPQIFPEGTPELTDSQVALAATELYFRHCAQEDAYVGISSDSIADLIRSYMKNEEIPQIRCLEKRVSLLDIAGENRNLTPKNFEKALPKIWESHPDIQLWYEYDFYEGMMWVYYNRMHPKAGSRPVFIPPPKEELDMGEIKKYYPDYYAELRNYLIQRMPRDEEGYYYSAIQQGDHPPYRSKLIGAFEMDHIVPISKNGKTVKENLQMILRTQNIRLGAKDQK